MSIDSANALFAELSASQVFEADQLEEITQDFLSQHTTAPALAAALVQGKWLTSYQSEQLLQGRGRNLVLGAYRILEPLGQGGMGQVFKAEQRRLNRLVALKVINQECLSKSPDAIRRFQREAKAAAQLSHPNTIVIYDADQVGDTHFIVMEYVEGLDLARLVRQYGALPVAPACEFIAQAALGLQHAHERGMIHRDIKPSNLFVARATRAARRDSGKRPASHVVPAEGADNAPDGEKTREPSQLALELLEDGVVKILDMGLARLIQTLGPHSESALTQEGKVMGTPDYIAPEQARDSRQVDGRADIYSLGCSLYFVLAGRPPFQEGTLIEKLLMHQLDEPVPIEELRPEVPGPLAAIVRKMMAKQPKDRFQAPLEIVEALAALNGPGLAVNPAAVSESVHPPSTAVCLVMPSSPTPVDKRKPVLQTPDLVAVSGINLPKARDTEIARLTGPPPARRIAALKGHNGCVMSLAFSLSRNQLASGGLDGTIHLWDFSDGEPREQAVLSTNGEEVLALSFAPDKKALVCGTSEGGLWLWDLKPRVPDLKASLSGHRAAITTLAFAADGRSLVTGGADHLLRIWDLYEEGPHERLTLRGHQGTITSVALTADGKKVASGSQVGDVRLWEPRRFWHKEQAVLPVSLCAVSCMAFAPDGGLLAVGSLDQTFQLWDLSPEEPVERARFVENQGGVRQIVIPPDGQTLVTVEDKGRASVWDVLAEARLREWTVPIAKTYSFALTFDGRYLATGTSDGNVLVYRIASRRKGDDRRSKDES